MKMIDEKVRDNLLDRITIVQVWISSKIEEGKLEHRFKLAYLGADKDDETDIRDILRAFYTDTYPDSNVKIHVSMAKEYQQLDKYHLSTINCGKNVVEILEVLTGVRNESPSEEKESPQVMAEELENNLKLK